MERRILAAASHYKRSYFFNNEEFPGLPVGVQAELRRLLTQACHHTCGVVLLGFYPDGEVFLEASGDETDFDYDEIGAKYHINALVREEAEFLRSLGLWYAFVDDNYEN
ncbi:MAG: DUF6145 family protein [Defluviitaleaceae bacterium]|nr:DUF6145 family protein [Defluviitaleaceae bacterium]